MASDTPDVDKALELAAAMYQIAEGEEMAVVIAALCALITGLVSLQGHPDQRMLSLSCDLMGLIRTIMADPAENPLLAFNEIRLRQKAVYQ